MIICYLSFIIRHIPALRSRLRMFLKRLSTGEFLIAPIDRSLQRLDVAFPRHSLPVDRIARLGIRPQAGQLAERLGLDRLELRLIAGHGTSRCEKGGSILRSSSVVMSAVVMTNDE